MTDGRFRSIGQDDDFWDDYDDGLDGDIDDEEFLYGDEEDDEDDGLGAVRRRRTTRRAPRRRPRRRSSRRGRPTGRRPAARPKARVSYDKVTRTTQITQPLAEVSHYWKDPISNITYRTDDFAITKADCYPYRGGTLGTFQPNTASVNSMFCYYPVDAGQGLLVRGMGYWRKRSTEPEEMADQFATSLYDASGTPALLSSGRVWVQVSDVTGRHESGPYMCEMALSLVNGPTSEFRSKDYKKPLKIGAVHVRQNSQVQFYINSATVLSNANSPDIILTCSLLTPVRRG